MELRTFDLLAIMMKIPSDGVGTFDLLAIMMKIPSDGVADLPCSPS